MKKTVSFQQQDTRFQGTFQQRLFRTLKLAYAPFLGRVAALIVIGFSGRFCLLVNTNLIGYWVDSYCKGPACRPLPSLLQNWESNDYIVSIFYLCAAGFLLTLFFRINISRLSAIAISRIYDEVTFRTSRFPLSFFDTTPAGRIITRFSSDYGNVFRLFGGPLAEFMAIIFDLLVMIILITIASPFYLFLVAIIVAINYLVYRYHRPTLRNERRQLSLTRAPSIAHFAETAQGVTSIRTYLQQTAFLKKFSTQNNLFLNQRMKTFKKLTWFSFQINSLTSFLLLVTGLASYYLLKIQWVSVGAIGVAFTFITLSGNTVQTFFEWLAQLEEALVGAERLDHYLHLPIEPGERLPSKAEFTTPHWTATQPPVPPTKPSRGEMPSASIKLDHVFFRYREDLPWVLKDISFEVSPGERLGIVGKTGSGKSTLIQVMFHLYPIAQGKISIADCSPYLAKERPPQPHEINLFDFRKLISLIPQDPILFRGTLRENLQMTGSKPDSEIIHCLYSVGLQTWFDGLAHGLDFTIEERGKNLSLGERQLLCMARSLLQDSPVIIMDEATASVDPQSEQIMEQATQKFFAHRTQIIIAHRLSTLHHCDRVLWIDNGSVKLFGPTHEVLPLFLQSEGHALHP